MSASALEVEELLSQSRERAQQPLGARELLCELAGALLFGSALAAMLAFAPSGVAFDPLVALGLIAAHVAAQQVEFEVGAGTTNASQLVLFPMLLLMPVALVPAAIVASLVIARLPACVRGRRHPQRLLLAVGDGWHAVGPALVIVLAGAPDPSLSLLGLYACALVAQFAFDAISGVARDWLALGVAPQLQVRSMAWVMLTDATLAPIGLLAGLAAADQPLAALLVMPLVALLASFAHDRHRAIDQAIDLSNAYRGTALLMGDMLEADDAYTGGEHSHGVVALAIAVGERLDVTGEAKRDLEFGALLHDVGKIFVPKEIINKPGALTPEEYEIVKRHPAAGEELLARIGGVLAGVGRIVRSHHERWDGRGYPDQLAGQDIPLGARIICACDAFSAMTTDRPYRAAMDVDVAVAELRACSGAQFDPRVVSALERVVALRAMGVEEGRDQQLSGRALGLV